MTRAEKNKYRNYWCQLFLKEPTDLKKMSVVDLVMKRPISSYVVNSHCRRSKGFTFTIDPSLNNLSCTDCVKILELQI